MVDGGKELALQTPTEGEAAMISSGCLQDSRKGTSADSELQIRCEVQFGFAPAFCRIVEFMMKRHAPAQTKRIESKIN